MSKELTIKPLAELARINAEQVDILRKTLFKGFNDDEIQFSLAVCNRTGLDPFIRQVHFTKRKNRKTNEDTIVITTGIDGLRLTANRSQAYAGSDEPKYEVNDKGKPLKARVTVYKIVQGVRCPFTAEARWDEFYPGDGNDGFMWRKMPFVMLGKCAEAQALRKSFPAELSNIYAHEEIAQANNERELVSTKASEVNRLLEAPDNIPDVEIEATEELEEPDFVTDTAAAEPPDLGAYVIPIGKKYKGKKLRDLSRGVLTDFVKWVDENIENKNGMTVEFLSTASAYLGQS